jgi:hypothetical protein
MAGLGVTGNDPFGLADIGNTLNGIVAASSALNSPLGLPWKGSQVGNGSTPVDSSFFKYINPDPSLWDKLCQYRLLVIDSSNNNKVIGGGDTSVVNIEPLGNATLAFTPQTSAWIFNLPITPQQLSISDIYSINTSMTLRGVMEQHSGVRLKNITIQGTFGVWPGRPSIVNPPGTPSVLQSVFGGTLSAAQNVATQFQSIINNITTGSNASKPVTIRPDSSITGNDITITDPSNPEYGGYGTGYFQTMMLTQFLEQYAEAKRDPANASWRLVFDIPKQNQSFVVTPVGFTWNENANRPMEINYNLQLKAWRRIDLKQTLVESELQVTQLTPGILQRILNTIQAAQNTAAAATNLIGAVRSDVDNILNIIRQTGLLVKGIAGVAIAASDLPAQLVGDAKSTISNFLATVDSNNLFGKSATDNTTIQQLAQIKALNQTNEGLSTAAVAGGQIGSNSAVSAKLNPSNSAFTDPLQYPLLFSQVPVNSLTLNTAQQTALQNEINTVGDFTVSDLKTMRNTILTLSTQLSNSFGGGDSYYSTLYNQPQPTGAGPMTLDQYDILESFYDLIEAYDVLTATNQLNDQQILNGLEYVNALASASQIDFSVPNSKIQVPVPFGLNIEQIATRYLGNPQAWLEIATLNELQEPYIDQNGFQYALLSNADGRNIVVGSSQDLFIGQTVYLHANNQAPTARDIIKIVQLSQTSFLLTLDGLANLNNYTVANQAYIQAYLPGTVNSQNVIFIPNSQVAPPYDQISIPASVANVDLVGISKVDLLLTPDGDLAVNNSGDFQLAAGIPNLIQALAIKFGTTLGSNLLEPSFGLGLKIGTSLADFSAKDTYNQIVKMVTSDPRFQGLTGFQINQSGPAIGINLGVQITGQSGLLPIGFQLPMGSL